jgi:hypothetical protein
MKQDWMKKRTRKIIPIGGYDVVEIANIVTNGPQSSKDGQEYRPARPLPYYCLLDRIRLAVDVLRYKADVIYWSE